MLIEYIWVHVFGVLGGNGCLVEDWTSDFNITHVCKDFCHSQLSYKLYGEKRKNIALLLNTNRLIEYVCACKHLGKVEERWLSGGSCPGAHWATSSLVKKNSIVNSRMCSCCWSLIEDGYGCELVLDLMTWCGYGPYLFGLQLTSLDDSNVLHLLICYNLLLWTENTRVFI